MKYLSAQFAQQADQLYYICVCCRSVKIAEILSFTFNTLRKTVFLFGTKSVLPHPSTCPPLAPKQPLNHWVINTPQKDLFDWERDLGDYGV